MLEKKMKGQFFTTTNPFMHDLFFKWISNIENLKDKVFIEPFAGTNNIVDMIEGLDFDNKWVCYDIDKRCKELTENHKYTVNTKNTLEYFPKGFDVAITNPPYLARNSATRSGIVFPNTKYNDLYKLSLEKMLENTKYVAAIIPASFLTQGIFHNRLFGVVSLTMRMFEDTSVPVCLALFIPEEQKEDINDFIIFSGDRKIGSFTEIQKYLSIPIKRQKYSFNDKKGLIGLIGIDNTKTNSIKFVDGDTILSDKVKETSRSITRINILDNKVNIKKVIKVANRILSEHREATSDLFLTPFKGLRADGKFRRRLDYKMAKTILDLAIEEVENA